MEQIKEEISRLKREKNAIILAHYYTPQEVQKIADAVGDSFYLSRLAKETKHSILVFCGVSFMGESAKILNPEKKVLLPEPQADCPMAHMASVEKIKQMREKYPNLAVVCYINSSAQLKQYADICVTSSNAVAIVKVLPNSEIYFIPDANLGHYVAKQVPEKNIIVNDGFCPIHKELSVKDVLLAKKTYPDAKVLVHPECLPEVVKLADYVGSTLEIIEYATSNHAKQYLIGTENGVLFELKRKNPNKEFYLISNQLLCTDMKKITLEKVRDCLRDETGQVEVSKELEEKAKIPLDEMLRLGKVIQKEIS